MSTNIRELAEQYNDYIIERRRYYHSCPELSGQEIHTTEALKVWKWSSARPVMVWWAPSRAESPARLW